MPFPPKSLITPPAYHTHSSQKAEEPDLREQIRKRDRQRKLDDAAARRLEVRKGKEQVREQQAAVRGEKARLDSLASVEQSRELWRLRDEYLREQKRLRDDSGLRAGGAYKRPAVTPRAGDHLLKRRLLDVEDRPSR